MTDKPPGVPDSTTAPVRRPLPPASRTRRLDRWTRASHNWITSHPIVFRTVTGSVIAFCIGLGIFVYQIVERLPDRNELSALGENAQGTTLFDLHDRPVFTLPTQYRIEVPIERISANLIKAVIAVEDVRFYEHHGMDGVRIVAAVIKDVRQQRAAEGASTITQQLARMSFLSADKTLRRKITEAILAQRIEHIYTKDEILQFYLNKAYFGDGLYGAEAAARGYFGKPAADLTPAEGALLAGLVKAPSSTNPTVNPARALARRNVVLKLMLDNGLIDPPDYVTALATPLQLSDSLRRSDPSGTHFKEQVRRELVERFGKDKVYEGHLKVYTTIDPAMQRAAEEAVTSTLTELDARVKPPRPARTRGRPEIPLPAPESGDTRLQAALLAIDPASGEVRAVVGGRDASNVGLNRALQSKRQPGSAFKPFVYATALESGYTPASVIDHLDEPIQTFKGGWLPDDEHSTASAMTIRTALRTSSNRAAVRMLDTVGIERTVSYATRLGVGAIPSVPSLALGSGEVTLASMSSAYAAFAAGGVVRDLTFIRRVEDEDGAVIFRPERRERRAITETTAFLMASMLADVVDAGTAARARRLGFTLPAAGKTGTTNDFMDAWFVGFTPKLLAGVWVGFDEPRTIMQRGFAADVAVPLWAKFMKAATKNDRKEWIQPPPGIVAVPVCRISGLLPQPGCKNVPSVDANGNITYKSAVYTEYFLSGTEPTQTCEVHTDAALLSVLYSVPGHGSDGPIPPPEAPPAPLTPAEPDRLTH